MVIDADSTEQRGAVTAFQFACRAEVFHAAIALALTQTRKTEAAAQSVPEIKRVRWATVPEAVDLTFWQEADENGAARAGHDTPVPHSEGTRREGRAHNGSTLQEEAVLGGDPYPVLSGVRRARQGWR